MIHTMSNISLNRIHQYSKTSQVGHFHKLDTSLNWTVFPGTESILRIDIMPNLYKLDAQIHPQIGRFAFPFQEKKSPIFHAILEIFN